MAVPWLSTFAKRVQTKLDQPETDPGQLTWSFDEEFSQAADGALRYTWERLSSLDKNFGMTINTALSVTAASRTFALPTDCRMLRKVVEIDGAGAEISGGEIVMGTWEDLGASERMAVYQQDVKQLYFMRVPTRSYSVKVIYGREPLPLAYGTAQSVGATSMALAAHERDEDDAFNAQTFRIRSATTGQGQTKAASDYDGVTRTITVTAWSPVPTGVVKYDTKPDLPTDATDFFLYDICGRMAEKLQDERLVLSFQNEREKHLAHFQQAASSYERRSPLLIRDAYGDVGFADPADTSIGWWST
jgi:hypothetical protein